MVAITGGVRGQGDFPQSPKLFGWMTILQHDQSTQFDAHPSRRYRFSMTTGYFLLRVIAATALCAYLAACTFLYFSQARFLFPGAFLPLPAEFADFGKRLGFEAASVIASDSEKLFVLHRAPAGDQPIVIVFHGNASYPEDYGFLYFGWIAAGYGIVAPTARGYPRSGGQADGEKMLADALDIYDWTARTYPGHMVYVLGQSMGCAPAVHLAARRTIAGAVLISPFKSMLSLVRSKLPYFPVSWLLQSPFRNDRDMPHITAPVMIVHGELDALVPIASARELAALAKTNVRFEVIKGAGHANGLFTPETTLTIDRFLGMDIQ
jgi:hypothetical protein